AHVGVRAGCDVDSANGLEGALRTLSEGEPPLAALNAVVVPLFLLPGWRLGVDCLRIGTHLHQNTEERTGASELLAQEAHRGELMKARLELDLHEGAYRSRGPWSK